jgi:hypothetical protein
MSVAIDLEGRFRLSGNDPAENAKAGLAVYYPIEDLIDRQDIEGLYRIMLAGWLSHLETGELGMKGDPFARGMYESKLRDKISKKTTALESYHQPRKGAKIIPFRKAA